MAENNSENKTGTADFNGSTELSVERARVIAIPAKSTEELAGSPADNVLWVETVVQQSCESCSARSGCGHSVLAKWFSRKRQCIPVRCREGEASLLTVGQWVEVGVPASSIVRASLLAYLLPLVGLLSGALAFSHFATHSGASLSGELFAIVGAVAGFLTGAMLSKTAGSRLFGGSQLPRFIRAVSQSDPL